MHKNLALHLVSDLAIAAAVVLPVNAVEVSKIPKPWETGTGWVTDMGGLITPETEQQLNQIISDLEAQNSAEIFIVTVPNTAPSATPKEFTTKLFNTWGIGKEGIDNGVLFVVSKGDRRVEIETGYGVEGILPDAQVGAIIDQKIIPQFKAGSFDRGILHGTQALVLELQPAQFPLQKTIRRNRGVIWQWSSIIGGVFVFGASIVGFDKWRKAPRYLEPTGRTEIRKGWFKRAIVCQTCKQPMTQISDKLTFQKINNLEKFLICAKNIQIEGWQCQNCTLDHNDTDNFHLLLTLLNSKSLNCAYCAPQNSDSGSVNHFFLDKILPIKETTICRHCHHTFLPPLGTSKHNKNDAYGHRTFCAHCRQTMKKIDIEHFVTELSEVEIFAIRQKYIKIEGFQCLECSTNSQERFPFHQLTSILRSNSMECPACHGQTMFTESQIIEAATYSHSGTKRYTTSCKYCQHIEKVKTVTLPKLKRSSSTSSSFSGSSSSSSRSSSSSSSRSSSRSSSSSSSRSGGGRSGGGGAGGSW